MADRITRTWIDWDAPMLPGAAARLLAIGDDQCGICRLDQMLCVLPGRRAGRILLHLLLDAATDAGLHLQPPRIVTPSQMVDVLLGIPSAETTGVDVLLGWLQTLQTSDDATRGMLEDADDRDNLAGLELAVRLEALDDELTRGLHDFKSVAQTIDRQGMSDVEVERWQRLSTLQAAYLDRMAAADRVDPNLRRRDRARRPRGGHPMKRLALVGVTDLDPLHRTVLDRLEIDVDVIIHAPEEHADAFDTFGAIRVDANLPLDLDDDHVVVSERASDQSQAALSEIAHLASDIAPGDVTIGLGDPSISDRLQREFGWAGVDLHQAMGRPFARTSPARLLDDVSRWLDSPRYHHLASLLRHPRLEGLVRRRFEDLAPVGEEGTPLFFSMSRIDRYAVDHLPDRPDRPWPGDDDDALRMRTAYDIVMSLLEPLDGEARPLGDWAQPLLTVLRRVFGVLPAEPDDDAGRITVEACRLIRDTVTRWTIAEPTSQPVVNASEAIRFLLSSMSRTTIPDRAGPEQVDLVGWLELHLDPAPVLIVTGFNEDFIPSRPSTDPFLSDGLRHALGLQDATRRWTRDRYLMQAMLRSRRIVRLIAGRSTVDGDPLLPSRLFLDTADDDTLLRRVGRFIDVKPTGASTFGRGLATPAEESAFVIPDLPRPLPEPDHLSPSSLRSYLECPYRFALKSLLKLRAVDDAAPEMDPMHFGNVVHDVLERFGRDESVNRSDDPRRIAAYLRETLNDEVRTRFGTAPSPAVRIQLARMTRRLSDFAQCQSRHVRSGWEIDSVELPIQEPLAMADPDVPPMVIHARVDRLDRHRETGAWMVIDYKTGDKGKGPYQTHHGAKEPGDDPEWKDLQLPLYGFLVEQYRPEVTNPSLAYIILPHTTDGVRVRLAEWTPAQKTAAIDLARTLITNIRAGEFELNHDHRPWWDDFKRICHSTVVGAGEEDGGE